MAKGADVLLMLMPNGGYTSMGNDYEGITFLNPKNKITKEEYEAGFETVDAWLTNKEASKTAAREAIFAKLGLTAEEVATLLG
jgi:hypothetical protein